MGKHKWNGPAGKVKRSANHGGYTNFCIKCGCVREFVKGIPTYLMGDNLFDKKAPDCPNKMQHPIYSPRATFN